MTDRRSLWEWRRAIADLYAGIRANPDPAAAHREWERRRRDLFRNHEQSPIEAAARAGYGGPFLYPYDPAMRFVVRLDRATGEALRMDTGTDGLADIVPFARTFGLAGTLGSELTLYWFEYYGGGAFLPFRDATSGPETYGGGRYLLDTIKGADLGSDGSGRTVLDFNFSYFPSCAYSPNFVCPLAPPANRLACPVRAGERLS